VAHHVFLIPGYLGYRGKQGYWGFWDAVLPLFRGRGLVCHPAATDPVAPIERRSERLRDFILETTESGAVLTGDDTLHLFGFSAGGLDARYLLSPATPVSLPDRVRARVRTVATLATPHYGTPLADFYSAWRAEGLLGFFAGIVSRWDVVGRLPSAAQAVQARRWTVERLLPRHAAEQFLRLAEGLTVASQEELAGVRAFLTSLVTRRGALEQLRVRPMRRFNRVVTDARDVRYVCYVTGAAPIRPVNFGTAVYALACFLASRWPISPPETPNEGRIPADRVATLDGIPCGPDSAPVVLPPSLTDGIVPTASQFWGECRAYAPIDHHAAYGRPYDLMRVPEFDGAGLSAFYGRIAEDLLDADGRLATPSPAR
jgi:hypothetical protein